MRIHLTLPRSNARDGGLTTKPRALSNDESAGLPILAANLTEKLQIGDDERLKAIFESLTIEQGSVSTGSVSTESASTEPVSTGVVSIDDRSLTTPCARIGRCETR